MALYLKDVLRSVVLMLAVSALLAGCGGGGGGDGGGGGGGGDNANSSQAMEPGMLIEGDYFPVVEGSRLSYNVTENDPATVVEQYLAVVTAEGAGTVNGRTVQVYSEANAETGQRLSVDYINKTSQALRNLAEDDSRSFDVVRFPLRVSDTFVQLNQQNMDLKADYDGDKVNESLTVYSEATVVGLEDVSTPAGSFSKALKIKGQATFTYYYTKSGRSVVVKGASYDWYAEGIGQVKHIDEYVYPNKTVTITYNLKSYKLGGRTNDKVSPKISQILPAANSVQGKGPVVQIGFDEDIDMFHLKRAGIKLVDAKQQVILGDFSYKDRTLFFTPRTALTTGSYVFSLTTDAVSDLAGNPLAKALTLPFSVDGSAPSVVATSPQMNAGGAALNGAIVLEFNEKIDPSSVNADSVVLNNLNSGDSLVPARVETDGKRIILTPLAPLVRNKQYRVQLTLDIKDLAGNYLPSSYELYFRTETGTVPYVTGSNPQANAVVEYPTREITLDFSEEMDEFSLSSESIQLYQLSGDEVVATKWANLRRQGKQIIITPDQELERGVRYRVCAYPYLQDMDGNPLREQYCFDFTVKTGMFLPAKLIGLASDSDAVAVGDVNGDGRNDVVVATNSSVGEDNAFAYKLVLLLQQADGTLAEPVKYPLRQSCSASSIVIADLDGDGQSEIAVGQGNYCGIEIFAQDSAGHWARQELLTGSDAGKIRVADLNHDGKLDIVGTGYDTNTVSVWYQDSGKFKNAVSYAVPHDGLAELSTGDINGDGRQDVVVLSVREPARLGYLLQLAAGGLDTPRYLSVNASYSYFGATAIGDVNGDGRNDILFALGISTPTTLGVYTLSGKQFVATSYVSEKISPTAMDIGDVNNDGRNDVLVMHGAAMSLYLQAQDGSLQAEEMYAVSNGAEYSDNALALGDINGDGYKDVVVAVNYGTIGIIYNNSTGNQSGSARQTASRQAPAKALGQPQLKKTPSRYLLPR